MADTGSTTIHATCVAIRGRAVLISGPSGSGKSDLALRLIDRGAVLVSDDYTILTRTGDELCATPPATIAGQMEVRGIGVIARPYMTDIPVALIVRIDAEVPRMPDDRRHAILGVAIREIALAPFPAATPIKIELALEQAPLP
ncbi:HPr kinase/phosphorylase [Sphingomonas abaci]|uniref:Serine kinase of HPr protein (Carbohydrate metabolism regulator) n=1 Tax=Sphingomonas abaci TaxID=237611 RepID=A0A7W7EVW8_9SPHN|nr:HPr kinase/phosphatase C-terminal domain-containing protein [Sphingomonas abaci]MBB4615947.1 serine kinase of HPr protein (carbohydrate metabolism regulator) [Sphingomonas abaci]